MSHMDCASMSEDRRVEWRVLLQVSVMIPSGWLRLLLNSTLLKLRVTLRK